MEGGEVDGAGGSIPHKWQEAKTRKGGVGVTIGLRRFLSSGPGGLVLWKKKILIFIVIFSVHFGIVVPSCSVCGLNSSCYNFRD